MFNRLRRFLTTHLLLTIRPRDDEHTPTIIPAVCDSCSVDAAVGLVGFTQGH